VISLLSHSEEWIGGFVFGLSVEALCFLVWIPIPIPAVLYGGLLLIGTCAMNQASRTSCIIYVCMAVFGLCAVPLRMVKVIHGPDT
jgi:hypothetical protein